MCNIRYKNMVVEALFKTTVQYNVRRACATVIFPVCKHDMHVVFFSEMRDECHYQIITYLHTTSCSRIHT